MDHQCIPRQALHWEVPGFREVQVVHVQTGGRLVKDVGGSVGGSSRHIRMASDCGPIHPLACGLNQAVYLLLQLIVLLRAVSVFSFI